MKFAIVIPDGAGDLPNEELDGRTPFEIARCPAFDRVATEGLFGTTCNVPEGLPAGSDVAILSLLGYDPRQVYTGRAPLEAIASDIKLADDDLVYRCNLVTVADGQMVDNSAGGISSEEGAALIEQLAGVLGSDRWEFHTGVAYRHLLIDRGGAARGRKIQTTPPHDILGRPIEGHLPRGNGSDELRRLMEASHDILAAHEVNRVREDLGEHVASQIWLWGQGTRPRLERFRQRWGLGGAAITAVDLVRGIARAIGWEVIDVPGATGYLDTNFEGKTEAAIAALERVDLVCVHLEATDETSHEGSLSRKIKAIEAVDQKVLGPLLDHMGSTCDDWRLMVLPDHLTPLSVRTHTADPVPVGIVGSDITPVHPGPYTEKHAAASGFRIPVGHELMEYFLRR